MLNQTLIPKANVPWSFQLGRLTQNKKEKRKNFENDVKILAYRLSIFAVVFVLNSTHDNKPAYSDQA